MTVAAQVLTVCTGNVCRSPAVERLLAAALGDPCVVGSAGTKAVVGAPVDPPMAGLLADAGVSAAGFASRPLTADLVRGAGLVLALTREHRAAVVKLVPAALRTTFTVRELARLLTVADLTGLPEDPAARLAELAVRARAARTLPGGRAQVASDDDVVDPYRGDDAKFAQSWAEFAGPVEVIAAALRG